MWARVMNDTLSHLPAFYISQLTIKRMTTLVRLWALLFEDILGVSDKNNINLSTKT